MNLVSLPALGWIAGIVVSAWTVPRKWQPYGTALITALFLAYYAPVSLGVLTLTTIGTYLPIKYRHHKTGVVLTVISFVSTLFVWIKLNSQMGISPAEYRLIPLGFSYYVLRQIHFIIESYKGTIARFEFGDYLCYLFFLPTITVGPIHRFPDFQRDLKRRRWDPVLFSAGLERILYGYVKIVFFGNYLVSQHFAGFIFQIEANYPTVAAYLDCILYGLNLYFQFGGFSDVAVGFSLLLGFRIIENFHFPFIARNINDFWQRWHISLSQWCRDYVYMPVVSFTRQPALAAVASMLVLGLWHELSFRYLAWALYHGLGIAAWQVLQKRKTSWPISANPWVRRSLDVGASIFTLNFVVLSFALTKEANLLDGLDVLKRILTFWL